MPAAVRIVPLGGLGEVGLNMLLVESEGAAIAIDCGVLFPDRPGLGIDLMLPDVTYLRERPGLLRGVVLTHGHEDHIGALPRLLAEFPVPVFGPRFATLLAREKLRRANVSVPIEMVEPGVRVDVGPFGVEPIHMTHSIVDSVAVAITTPQGVIIHTGDFKIDPRPIDGRTSDLERLAEWGRRGVLLLLSDSTNAASWFIGDGWPASLAATVSSPYGGRQQDERALQGLLAAWLNQLSETQRVSIGPWDRLRFSECS